MTSSSERNYRDTLGIYPTGVTVITTLDSNNVPVGFTANSFSSVSLDPKLVLWNLATSSDLIPIFQAAKGYAIHFLCLEQVDISNTFASPVEDRFDNLDWSLSTQGLPIINGCAAYLECESRQCHAGGDHSIFIGEVTNYACDTSKKPLAYHLGNYAQCIPAS